MKKVLQFLLVFIISVNSFAQMDTEHWFAPMYDTYTVFNTDYDNTKNGDYLYISTDATDDFEVTVYSGNIVIDKIAVRKGSPKYVQIPPDIVTTKDPSNTFLSSSRGLHLVGSRKFFANLRILRGPHAEIINSKGFAGLGTDFYAMTTPLSVQQSNLSSQINILATENNTSVKISGYDPNILFQNGTKAPELNIKLNKGESYMVSVPNRPPFVVDSTGLGDPDENYFGLIGANINSNKPISVTNGSFNGTYVNASFGNDILMDQAVPVNRLGKEYVIAKGNGPVRASNQGGIDSERVIVIATKDNTKFTINDNPTVHTLDKGKYEIIYGSESYKMQAPDIYNMYIKSSEDLYVYQLLAGSALFDSASGGMNMIPSLNCLLPNQIVELPEVNQIGTKDDFETTVNIITKKGAQVKMNGELLNGVYGPYPVSGTPEWVLFTKKNVKGSLSIYSTDAVTVGLAGGNKAVGYGGFFGGFSSVPQIIKTGDCTIGVKLQVDDGYDFYEWYLNNNLIASGKKIYFIDPELYGSGNYQCKVLKNLCGNFTTSVFPYNQCPVFSSVTIKTNNCKLSDALLVEFSRNASLPVNINSIIITKQPEAGSVSKPYLDKGKIYINYDPENTDLSQVTFKYYFEGFGVFPDSEEVTVTINIAQIKLQNQEGTECLGYDGKGIYNLREIFEIPVNNDPTYSLYEYYQDKTLTKKIPEVDVSNQYNEVKSYKSMPGQIVYVKVTNIYGCNNQTLPAEIVLKTFELPTINTIEVEETNSVKIDVSKGKPGYYFYIKKNGKETDFIPESAYTYFDKVPATIPIYDGKGKYMVYVKSADNCLPVTQNFSVIGISNVITPNDDGANDFIDYSDLMTKLNPRFEVYDRNGKSIFKGSPENRYIWNGKSSGKELPTSSYWYLLEWNESSISKRTQKSGWILLKNRN